MLNLEIMQCDFCQSPNLFNVYDVLTSRLGAVIYCCLDCGLHQSKYANKANKHTHKSISCGADWGNIRHGKKIRLQPSLNVLQFFLNLNELNSILDVGSNRGHFVNYVISNTKCNVTAIEPDIRIVEDYVKDIRITTIHERYENCKIKSKFDLIYCCHTLEHADSASHMILQMREQLNVDGYLYIDVPSIEVLKNHTNVEEFFIDKHTFHFSLNVLKNYLEFLGFHIIYAGDDESNIIILCQKRNNIAAIKNTITQYSHVLLKNQTLLIEVSSFIHKICNTHRVVLYGASKIYDALVRYGKLNPNLPFVIVDDYLYGYIDNVHGKELTPTSKISAENTDVVILLTKSSTNQLVKKLTQLNIKHLIPFHELLDENTFNWSKRIYS